MAKTAKKPASKKATQPSTVSSGKNDAEFLRAQGTVLQMRDEVFKALGLNNNEFSNINYGTGRITNLGQQGMGKLTLIGNAIQQIIPKTKQACIEKAYAFYDSDDFLASLINMMVDFCASGFGLQPVPKVMKKEAYDDATMRSDLLTAFNMEMSFYKVVRTLFKDYFISDSAILYWKVKTGRTKTSRSTSTLLPELLEVNALHPGQVDWCNSGGQDILKVWIPASTSSAIKEEVEVLTKKKLSKQKIVESLREKGYGLAWIEAVMAGKDIVTLSNDDGDYWIVETNERKHHGLAWPSMKTVFTKLTIRSFFQEGELSASFLFAFFIMMIKTGESITAGPKAGMTTNWVKPEEATAIQKKFNEYSKALRIVMNHTTDVSWIFPPKEMFDQDRMKGPNTSILNWAGYTESLFMGQGGNYSDGYLGLRKAQARMWASRDAISMLNAKFFSHPTIAGQTRVMKSMGVQTVFDSNILKEPKQLLDESKFLFENSITDQRTVLRELQRNPETVKASTIQSAAEQKELKVWTGVGDQGKNKSKNPGGRPNTKGTSQDEYTRLQPPSPGPTQS